MSSRSVTPELPSAIERFEGMGDEMLGELMAVVGMANQTNVLANGLQVEIDDTFKNGGRRP